MHGTSGQLSFAAQIPFFCSTTFLLLKYLFSAQIPVFAAQIPFFCSNTLLLLKYFFASFFTEDYRYDLPGESNVKTQMSNVKTQMSKVKSQNSIVKCQQSKVKSNVKLNVKCQMSSIKCKIFLMTFLVECMWNGGSKKQLQEGGENKACD